MVVNTFKKNALITVLCLVATDLSATPSPSIGVFSAYTYTNDLGIALTDSSSTKAISRSGFKLGSEVNWANINNQGGSNLSLFANQDKDLNDGRDISDFGFNALYLQALSSHWLLRSQLMLNQYRNGVLPSTGFNGISIIATAGYMAEKNSGLDISLNMQNEQHQEDKNDQYNTNRLRLALDYYFPSKINSPQWRVQLHRQNNQANNDARDYISGLIGLSYRNWQLSNNIQGNISLQQRQDVYRSLNTSSRKDVLSFISIDIFKPLTKRIALRSEISNGLYKSTLQNSNQNYLQINFGIQISL